MGKRRRGDTWNKEGEEDDVMRRLGESGRRGVERWRGTDFRALNKVDDDEAPLIVLACVQRAMQNQGYSGGRTSPWREPTQLIIGGDAGGGAAIHTPSGMHARAVPLVWQRCLMPDWAALSKARW